MLCALGKKDPELCRSLVANIPESSKLDPLTLLLSFRIALQINDRGLGKSLCSVVHQRFYLS